MQCQQANEFFSDYIERNLDSALTVSVDNHLVACASCREEVEGLRILWTELVRMPVIEAPVALHASIMSVLDAHLAEINRETIVSRVPSFNWDLSQLFRPRTLAYAAVLMVFVLGGLKVMGTQAGLGWLIHSSYRPSVVAMPLAITATRSQWSANSDGSGTLTIVLQTLPLKEGPVATLNYMAELKKGVSADASETSSVVLSSTQGHFSSAGNATVTLFVQQEKELQSTDLSLVFTLLPSENGSAADAQKVIVPLKLPDSMKHDPNN